VEDASNGAEGGKIAIGVATHDGEFQNGLVIEDGNLEDEIDVTIANGTASVTTIAGETLFTGITRMNSQSVDMGSGASTTLTPTAPLVLLDADSVTGDSTFFNQHNISITTSGYTTGDTVRFVITTDVNENMAFSSGILLASGKLFGIPSSDAKGGSFTLVYTGSAWAVLGTNGIPSIA
jgi:hypothetical protein